MNNLQKYPSDFFHVTSDSHLKKGWKVIGKKHLVNTLNYVNFQDGTILINLKHKRYNNKIITLQARPQPCLGNGLDCVWAESSGIIQKLRSYDFLNFLVADGKELILVEPDLKRIGEKGISFNLPETCFQVSSRRARRHLCKGIDVRFIQGGVTFYGILLDFNAISFRVEIFIIPPQTFQWINPENSVNITFTGDGDILYSGECKIIRQTYGQNRRVFVLKPLNYQIHRFKPKEFRSERQILFPSPDIVFKHPLTGKMVSLKIKDISGSGFAVDEYSDHSVLLPGMIIPELDIEFTNNFTIRCKVQVVYRSEEDSTTVKCGLAILNMAIKDQVRLSALLHQAKNEKTYVCNKVELDALWNFFFETGFVYPKKYAFIQANKERFKNLYERLYSHDSDIARHFIYQDKGTIYGHVSMIRSYENTWIIHHHAATRSNYSMAGLVVLEQIGRYINDFHRLYSTHMNFVACYFRPENRFPDRVFGGVARCTKDPKICSLDSFAYLHYPKATDNWNLSGSWTLIETRPEDLLELEIFYDHESGGLMLHAMDLEADMMRHNSLNKEYRRLGFKRERLLFSLKRHEDLKAIIVVNLSDIGLNMSNLTNCIHIFVLDSEGLPRDTISLVLSILGEHYEEETIPVLVYPVRYAETHSIPYEKIYNFWVLNMEYTDQYFRYINNLLCRTNHK